MSTPAPPFKGVLLDMDGVLTDSEPGFHAAVNDILARFGEHIPMAEYKRFIGTPTHTTWRGLIELKQLPVTLERVLDDFEGPLMQRLREPRPPLPGARDLLEELHRRGVPFALCTASYTRWVEAILESAGLSGLVDVISSADMVEVTKPDPAPYRLAARKLGLQACECIAVEDSVSGLTSALRAGAYVVQVRATTYGADPHPGAAMIIGTLAEFPWSLLEAERRG